MKIPQKYYLQPTLKITQNLLGKVLIRKFRNKFYQGVITETEAYIGFKDKASHASRGKTKRNQIMFAKGGRAYIYLIYGMYYCFNIITEKKNYPSAVLIRSIIPIKNKQNTNNLDFTPNKLTNGPGKLCNYLKIKKTLNNQSLTSSKIWLEDWKIKIPKNKIKKTKRIGIDYAEECKNYLWRFIAK